MTEQTEGQRHEADGADKSSTSVVDLGIYRQSLDPSRSPSIVVKLDAILWVYGRMVGEGDWRDYAIDHLKDKAVFSVFKRAGDYPLYRIEKNPKLAAKQGAFSVVATDGRTLKRGHDLKQVLKVFDKALKAID